MASVMTTVEDRADPIEAIADFMAGFSLETTRPSADDVAALAGIVPAGTSVYVNRSAAEAGARDDRNRGAAAHGRLRAGAAPCRARLCQRA
jgi:hypothetical protein